MWWGTLNIVICKLRGISPSSVILPFQWHILYLFELNASIGYNWCSFSIACEGINYFQTINFFHRFFLSFEIWLFCKIAKNESLIFNILLYSLQLSVRKIKAGLLNQQGLFLTILSRYWFLVFNWDFTKHLILIKTKEKGYRKLTNLYSNHTITNSGDSLHHFGDYICCISFLHVFMMFKLNQLKYHNDFSQKYVKWYNYPDITVNCIVWLISPGYHFKVT